MGRPARREVHKAERKKGAGKRREVHKAARKAKGRREGRRR